MTTFFQGLAEAGGNASAATSLAFTQWIAESLPPAGYDGKAPDQRKSQAQTLKYLNGRRETLIDIAKMRPMVRLADKDMNILCEIRGEIDCSVEELLGDTGKLNMTLMYENWIADYLVHQTREIEDLHIIVDADPTNPNWRTRWGGKITEIRLKQDTKGIHTIELTALSNREHAKRLLVAANPFFAPEIQIPRMWVMAGPCRTALATTMFVNLARLFMPVWSTVTNIFNPAAWFNPLGLDAVLNFLPTAWPIQVAFVNPILDQSRWTCVGATWTDWHSTFRDILQDSGCVLRAYTYLTTDDDSPNTELVEFLQAFPDLVGAFTGVDLSETNKTIEQICSPLRNAVVFAVEQNDGRTGPTGTVVDGVIATVAVTLDDLITPVTVDLSTGRTFDPGGVLNGQQLEEATGVDRTYLLEQLTGTAPDPPTVIWWEGDYGGPISTDLTFNKSSVKTIMTGGKSPTLVNEAQTFAIKYALSQIQTVITTGLIANVGGPPIGAGLDDLYQGQLDNTLFAWQRFTNPIRALQAGDLAWQEHFEKGTGTAYTLATVLTLRSGDFKTRPFAAFKATVANGQPWIAERDYYLGDRVGFENDGIIWVDVVTSIKRRWSRNEGLKVIVGIGEDRNKDDPFAAAFRAIGTLWSGVGMLTGSGTIFG